MIRFVTVINNDETISYRREDLSGAQSCKLSTIRCIHCRADKQQVTGMQWQMFAIKLEYGSWKLCFHSGKNIFFWKFASPIEGNVSINCQGQ